MATQPQIGAVWGTEDGLQLVCERMPNGQVKVIVWKWPGCADGGILASMTVEAYRWDRIVEEMKIKESSQGQKPGGRYPT